MFSRLTLQCCLLVSIYLISGCWVIKQIDFEVLMILQQMLFMNLLGRVFEELKNFQSGY
jgi:hypothetical protein